MPKQSSTSVSTSASYKEMGQKTLPTYLANLPEIKKLLEGIPASWNVREVGDGNLNLIFIVESKKASLVVKQALPYVRMVGDSWPLPLARAFFEHSALCEQIKHAPEYTPHIYHYDHDMALIVMEYLSPHITLRKGLIAGLPYPNIAEHMGIYLARTLFSTSDFGMSADEKKKLMSVFCANTAMCKITEDVVFTEPFYNAPMNRWTCPQLDKLVKESHNSRLIKSAVQELKYIFLTRAEAMIHGDLHTGSVMVTEHDTRVIDPEFAFFGPIGFDIGTFIANLLMAYYSQPAHEERLGKRAAYQQWILLQIEKLWQVFAAEFSRLWFEISKKNSYGSGLPVLQSAADSPLSDFILQNRLKSIWLDAIGFAAVEIIRRITGLAHIEDFESINDSNQRAACEENALVLAFDILRQNRAFRFAAPFDLVEAARESVAENIAA